MPDEYGIVMGTSHVEPMMRADKEWSRHGYAAAEWNFAKNPDQLHAFWEEGIERTKNYESIVTLAMRGKVDTADGLHRQHAIQHRPVGKSCR